MQRSKGLAMMFLLGTLVVGGALGFSADRVFSRATLCVQRSDRGGWRDRFADDLHLRPAQRATLDSILDKLHGERVAAQATIRPQIDSLHALVDSLQATVRPQLDSIRIQGRVEIAKMLDADQKVTFQQMVQRSDEHAREEKKKR